MSKKRKIQKRGPEDYFIQVPTQWIQNPHESWLSLHYGARNLWLVLCSFYNGRNNGEIYMSIRKAAKLLGASNTSVEKWFIQLQDRGYIHLQEGGHLGVNGKGIANKWRLTHIGYRGLQPTKDFLQWKP